VQRYGYKILGIGATSRGTGIPSRWERATHLLSATPMQIKCAKLYPCLSSLEYWWGATSKLGMRAQHPLFYWAEFPAPRGWLKRDEPSQRKPCCGLHALEGACGQTRHRSVPAFTRGGRGTIPRARHGLNETAGCLAPECTKLPHNLARIIFWVP
jgi:hypothetical protein